MKTFKQFVYEAHLINTDPHDDYDIEKTDKMGPSQTTFKHRKTGIHVTATHTGYDQKGRPVHTVAWHHPETEGKKDTLSHKERVKVGLHGIRAVKELSHRMPKNSVVHASPTKDETEKSNTENTRGGIYRRMGAGPATLDKDTGEYNQYAHIDKKGKAKPLHSHEVEVTPETRHDDEKETKKPSSHVPTEAERKAHEREMRRLDALERRRNR